MPAAGIEINELLTVDEIFICCELVNYTSLRSAARAFAIDPSLLSRKLKNIEAKLKIKAVIKSPSGISFSDSFMQISQKSSLILKQVQSLKLDHIDNALFDKTLTIAGPGYLNSIFAGTLSNCMALTHPRTRLRFIDVSPIEALEFAKNGLVDVVFSSNSIELERRFLAVNLAEFDWRFFARTDHPVFGGEKKSYPVVSPTFYDGHKFNTLKINLEMNPEPVWGHESQTASSALGIATGSESLAFLPLLSAYTHVKLGQVKILSKELLPFSCPKQTLSMYVEKDKVKKSTLDAFKKAVELKIDEVTNEICSPS